MPEIVAQKHRARTTSGRLAWKRSSAAHLQPALGQGEPAGSENGRQIGVVRGENEVNFGILVDGLGEILEVPSADIEDLANIYVGIASVLASEVKTTPQNGGGMLVLLSVGSMSRHLHGKPVPAALSD